MLYRDRRYRLLLDQVAAARQHGETLKLCELLHELSSAPEDVFVWEDTAQRPLSARDAAGRCIAQLSSNERAAYERYIGAAADVALAELLRDERLTQLPAFIQKYPGSEAAFRAEVLLARQLFDSGRLPEAADCWRRIFADPRSRTLPTTDRLQAAVAARLAGDDDMADRLSARGASPIQVGDQSHSLPDAVALACSGLQAHPSRPAPTPARWALCNGSLEGSIATRGSLPHPVPLWSSRPPPTDETTTLQASDWQLWLPPPADETVVNPAAEWLRAQIDDGVPPISATLPIVVNGQVIVRELDSLAARDLETGNLLWRHRCQSPLQGLLHSVPSDHADATAPDAAYTQRAAENSLLSVLSTDGQHLFYVDGLEEIPLPSMDDIEWLASEGAPTAPRQLTNRLVALRLPDGTRRAGHAEAAAPPQPLWIVGGRNEPGAGDLAGHFFLGPPTPVDGQLLVLTEKAGQVNLLGLDAASGRRLWSQGLALVDRPISLDRERLRLAFLPAVTRGLVLCPTPCGAVIAFDLTQHRLVWTAQYRALDAGLHAGWRGDGRFAAALFPVQPVVVGESFIILPPDSPELTAFRLSDGARQWGLPRRGAQQLAVVDEHSLLQVSADRLACVNVADGTVMWERSQPFMTGRGVLLGGRWLAPMADGRLLAIDVATGTPAAGGPEVLEASLFGSPRRQPLLASSTTGRIGALKRPSLPAHRWGNLAVCGDWIISASPSEIAALAQAEALHLSLRNVAEGSNNAPSADSHGVNHAFDRVVASWDNSQRLLRQAEVELTLAQSAAAIPSLREFVSLPSASVPAGSSARARHLLQELLYARLATPLEDAEIESALAELAPLAQSPSESARWWLATLRQAAGTGDSARFLAAAERIAAFPESLLIPGDLAHSYLYRPASCIPQEWERLSEQLTDSGRWQLAKLVAERCQAVLAAETPPSADELRHWIRIYDGLPEGDRLRMALALHEAEASRLLSAESLLLEARRSPRTQTTLEAGYALTRLWQPRNLNLEIAAIRRAERRILSQSGGMTHPIRLEREWDGPIEAVAYRPEDPLRLPERFSVLSHLQRVQIATTERPLGDEATLPINGPNLQALLENRREFQRDAGRTLRLVSLGDVADSAARSGDGSLLDALPQVQLALVHRETGNIVSTVSVPARSREPSSLNLQPDAGHFLPLADSQVYGVSLLDASILWTAAPGESVSRGDRLRLGPSGPNYCIVQTPEGVCNLDPLTGLVRWQRRDIASDAGLYASEDTGILGDDEVLVVFESDLRTCRVLATQTGELLRTAQAPIDSRDTRRPRLAFGRRLFFATDTRTAPRFRVWDAATETIVLDVPAHPRLCSTRVDRDTLACVAEDGGVIVYDAVHGRRLLREAVASVPTGDISGLQVWRDADHWYIHLAHTSAADGSTRFENASTDVHLPGTTINGTLAVIDRIGRRAPWQLRLQNRTVLAGAVLEAPFLVTVARLQEPFGTQSASLLLEVFDKQTGRRIGEQQFERKRLAHAAYDVTDHALSLYAEGMRIDIRSVPPLDGSLLAVEEDPVSVNQ